MTYLVDMEIIKMKHIILAAAVWLFLYSCNTSVEDSVEDPFEHIKDPMVMDVLRKCIEAHGGLTVWRNLQSLDYTKDFELYLEDGSVENSYQQVHKYQFDKNRYEIITTDNSGTSTMIRDSDDIRKVQNGEKIEAKKETLEKSMNSATYVVAIPFKLLDPGVRLVYEGTKMVNSNRKAHVILAQYDSINNLNHSTSDEWRYFIDVESLLVTANMVYAHDHNAWIDNLTYDDGPIKFNKHRKSYRCDSLGNKLYLRAEYFYDNYITQSVKMTSN